MNTLLPESVQGLSVLMDIAIKSVLLLGLGAAISLIVSRRSAALRHLIWLFTLVGMLCLPFLSITLPALRLAVLPVPENTEPPQAMAPSVKVEPSLDGQPLLTDATPTIPQWHNPAEAVPWLLHQRFDSDFERMLRGRGTSMNEDEHPAAPADVAASGAIVTPAPTVHSDLPSWPIWFMAAWIAGATISGGWWLLSYAAVLRIITRARPVTDSAWQQLLNDGRSLIGLSRNVTLLQSEMPHMPMTVGWLRPVILIGSDADAWDAQRKQVVILHELAHIRRFDCLSQALGHFAVSLYWFNPLAWFALRRMKIESEHACDDAVLVAGSKASDYAEHLMHIARSLRSIRYGGAAGIAMARPAHLEGRLLAILDATRDRRSAKRTWALTAMIASIVLLLPLASVHLSQQSRGESPSPQAATQDFSVTFLVRDKMEKPLSGVNVSVEWIPADQWPYETLGIGQTTWPLQSITTLKPAGQVTAKTDQDGLAKLQWSASADGPLRLLLTMQKDGYQSLSRLPFHGSIKAGEDDTIDAPTLGRIEDFVTLSGQLVDAASNTPVADARLAELQFWHYWRRRQVWDTDNTGHFSITICVRNHSLNDRPSLAVQAAGYPIQSGELVDRTGQPIDLTKPELAGQTLNDVQLKIRQGVTIPGKLVRADGRPVANAKMQWEPVRWHYVLHSTNEQGVFQFGPLLPKNDAANKYGPYTDITWPGFTRAFQATLRDFKEFPEEWVIRLPASQTLRGRVVDERNNPVTRAAINVGQDMGNWITAEARDLPDGRFEVDADEIPAPGAVVSVEASGFAPTVVTVPKAMLSDPENTFVMKKPAAASGSVVDTEGKPIQKVWITSESIGPTRLIRVGTSTDMEGNFSVGNMPADLPVSFSILKEGYRPLRNVTMKPGKADHRFVMHKPAVVRGVVSDAETGKPIENFIAIGGIILNPEGGPPHWPRNNAKEFTSGQFEMTFSEPYPARAIRIEAEGYLPAVSRTIPDSEENATLEFSLTKGVDLTGVVRTGKDGAPAIGATVVMATPDITAYIRNGKDVHDQGGPQATTDNNGRFVFPPQIDAFTLVVIHNSGYAETTREELASGRDIVLQPWGQVTGRLLAGTKPMADERVNAQLRNSDSSEDEPRVYHDIKTTTNSAGEFSFERLPPGRIILARGIYTDMGGGRGMISYSHNTPVQIEPGKTLQVQLGGKGRPVSGRVFASHLPKTGWEIGDFDIQSIVDLPKAPIPEDIPAEEKQKWFNEWQKTPDGKKYRKTQDEAYALQRRYAMKIGPDGTFRVDDVEAGEYELVFRLNEPPPADQCGFGDVIGTLSHKFTVPEIPGGRSDKPLDLGKLEMKMLTQIHVGDEAPAFTATSLDGESEIKLADFKGKYVLLDFWATWCAPCVAETPNFKTTFDEFGSDPRFAMVSLSFDFKLDEPKAYIEKNGLKWTQGFLGEWGKSKIPGTYGMRGIPSIWLIGPDGKVIAKDLRGDKIKQAVAEALGKN